MSRGLLLLLLFTFLCAGAPELVRANVVPEVLPETFAQRLSNSDFLNYSRHAARKTKTLEVPTLIPLGTELNAVFDLSCIHNPSRHKGTDRISKQVHLPREKIAMIQRNPRRFSPLHSATWRLAEATTWSQLKKLVSEERCLLALTRDAEIRALSTSDPLVSRQEHLSFIGWPTAIRRFKSVVGNAPPMVIAVIDTGVDLSHPDLAANAWVNPREIPGNGWDDDFNGYIDDVNGFDFGSNTGSSGPKSSDAYFRHGTHVAGLAAASWDNAQGGSGVNGRARIMSLNVFGSKRTAKVSTLENALRYAVDNGADVINLSIGGSEYTSSMLETLRYAVRRGTVIVAAAGNEGLEISRDPASPRFVTPAVYGASLNGMITVGSVDTRTGRLSHFSNFSMFLVELTAPGAFKSGSLGKEGLFSTLPGRGYGSLSGTSMAAPVVSGAAGLAQAWFRAAGKPMSPALIERALTESARTSPGALVFTRSGRIIDLDNLADWLQREAPL